MESLRERALLRRAERRRWSDEPSEPVQDRGAGDGDVQAGTGAYHRDLHGHVQQVDGLGQDARLLVPEDSDGALAGAG